MSPAGRACAAILAHGCDAATVAEFTGLLSNAPEPVASC